MASIVGKKGIPTCILVRKEEVRRWLGWWGERGGRGGGGQRAMVVGTFLPVPALTY